MPFSRGAVPRTMGTMNNYVVVGVDGSASSRSAVRWAASYAASQATSLVLVHAGRVPRAVDGSTTPDEAALRVRVPAPGRPSPHHGSSRTPPQGHPCPWRQY
ncbi:hypothetical protein BJF84_07685 [Rhodococcus sp. CUA-806]|nr:hypothetical protein BJF84_07685 [Rhodococcus sp. CUA-806]